MEGVIPLTDSRLRPDIRAMENGDIGEVYDIGLVFFWHTSLKTICGDIQVFYIRALLLDLASAEKKRLEEKQRMARKNRTKSSEDWKTRSVTG